MEHKIKILSTEFVTHDVRRYKTEKPKNFKFIPGQATDLAINLPEYKDQKRPFTFTSLNEDSNLEFTIKSYKERNGVTKKLLDLKKGDEFIITDPFGTIEYKGAGVFIAGGAGITPFIAILRKLRKENNLIGNTLIFSNKTEKDIILKEELDKMAEHGLNLIYTLTREKNPKYKTERINEKFLKENIKDFTQNFYVCGPIRFVGEIQHALRKLGADADSIVLET